MPSQPVYSSQFIAYNASVGSLDFAVPTGWTAVVRDFSMWDEAGGAVAQLLIQDSEAAPAITAAVVKSAGIAAYSQWVGRVVVPGGGIISVTLTSVITTPDIYAGGYLLQNT